MITIEIDELEQLVEDSPNNDSKIIFTGHRGEDNNGYIFKTKNKAITFRAATRD